MSSASGLPEAPAQAVELFGERFEVAREFAELLATEASTRGLVGPREVGRLWDRHLLNCAVVSDLVPRDARVVDVGSGAGLPGLVLAIRRPDLRVDLVEPLERRVTFLNEAVARLRLGDTVRVVRGRAEEPGIVAMVGAAEWVTARAVAPLDRLVRWCLPMLQPGGWLLALKGASAAMEVREHRPAIDELGGRDTSVIRCGEGLLAEPTTVVRIRRGATPARRGMKGRA
ncbi:MAG: 16S rRNA (guanine(527)-N(7))-methyltransferase RsmG [Pseudonocardiales bacterium]